MKRKSLDFIHLCPNLLLLRGCYSCPASPRSASSAYYLRRPPPSPSDLSVLCTDPLTTCCAPRAPYSSRRAPRASSSSFGDPPPNFGSKLMISRITSAYHELTLALETALYSCACCRSANIFTGQKPLGSCRLTLICDLCTSRGIVE